MEAVVDVVVALVAVAAELAEVDVAAELGVQQAEVVLGVMGVVVVAAEAAEVELCRGLLLARHQWVWMEVAMDQRLSALLAHLERLPTTGVQSLDLMAPLQDHPVVRPRHTELHPI
jgi:hypothetical protein